MSVHLLVSKFGQVLICGTPSSSFDRQQRRYLLPGGHVASRFEDGTEIVVLVKWCLTNRVDRTTAASQSLYLEPCECQFEITYHSAANTIVMEYCHAASSKQVDDHDRAATKLVEASIDRMSCDRFGTFLQQDKGLSSSGMGAWSRTHTNS